jgi:hypothetical protein
MKLLPTDDIVKKVQDLLDEDTDSDCSDRFLNTFTAQTTSQYDDIVALNRFWRIELTKVPVNTISERECLIDNIDPLDWLRHFKSQVLPTIIRWKLPK